MPPAVPNCSTGINFVITTWVVVICSSIPTGKLEMVVKSTVHTVEYILCCNVVCVFSPTMDTQVRNVIFCCRRSMNRLLSHCLVGCYFQANWPVLRTERLYIFIADHSRGKSERLYDNVPLYHCCTRCVCECVCELVCMVVRMQLWPGFL